MKRTHRTQDYWADEPWTGSRDDYLRSVVGVFVLAFCAGAWGFFLVAVAS